MTHPALTANSVALVTGGASGIGLAAAQKFASLGMKLAIVDQNDTKLGYPLVDRIRFQSLRQNLPQ